MKYCALCCIAKDEDLYLKEWLAYHALIGFEHFIIYDDLSAVPIADLLGDWASDECVTIIRHTERRDQIKTYNHCLETYGRNFKWIAFLDLDEFLRLGPVTAGRETADDPWQSDIRIFLSEFEPYAALGLNWRMFSWGGHETTPEGPVIGSYTRTLGDDVHIKTIVQPARIFNCAGAHSFNPLPGHHTVNADHFPIPPGFPFTVPATSRAAINHYFYKSRQCFEMKVARGNPCNIERSMKEFDDHLGQPETRDESLLPWSGSVSRACAGGSMPLAPVPRKVPRDQHGDESPDDLTSAQTCVRMAREQKGEEARRTLRQALLFMAGVSALNDADGMPDPLISMELWTLRAEAAILCGQTGLAEFFLKQAFICGPSRHAYSELATLLLRSGRQNDAKQVLGIFRKFKELSE